MAAFDTALPNSVSGVLVSGGGGKTSAPTTASTPPPASAASQTYSSKAFVVPFTVTVDAALKSPPIRDSSHFLTWDAGASQENKVRFLVPVVVFRAGKETPQAPPKEYLKYLMAQAKDGAVFSNVTKITVDGHPATLMDTTGTAPEGFLSGLLGCFERVPTSTEIAASGSSRVVSGGWPPSMSVIPRSWPGPAARVCPTRSSLRCSSACSKAFDFANAAPTPHEQNWHSTWPGRATVIVPGHATRVPHPTDNPGTQRTTTVSALRDPRAVT
jgi:hypothetical protein